MAEGFVTGLLKEQRFLVVLVDGLVQAEDAEERFVEAGGVARGLDCGEDIGGGEFTQRRLQLVA